MKSETKTSGISAAPDGTYAEERRSFLGVIIAGIASIIGGALSLAAGRFAIEPTLAAAQTEQWITAGPLAEIPEGKPVRRAVTIVQEAGWGRFHEPGSVWVVRNGEALMVFSAVCPHLGCSINASADGFVCPCHRSSWDGTGVKTGGPAPRNMDTLEHRIENGALLVRYQNFKQGTAEREVV